MRKDIRYGTLKKKEPRIWYGISYRKQYKTIDTVYWYYCKKMKKVTGTVSQQKIKQDRYWYKKCHFKTIYQLQETVCDEGRFVSGKGHVLPR